MAAYASMRGLLGDAHNEMHGFINMGGTHTSFRDPFVFLLHSNVDRLFAMWQAAPEHAEGLDPNQVYASSGVSPSQLSNTIAPWSGVPPTTRPWAPPENQQAAITYKDPSVVVPPLYDTDPAGGFSTRAAVVWPNGKAYFFRGNEYIRYDMAKDSADPGYPLPIVGMWPGLR